MPTVTPQWVCFSYDWVAAWATPYTNRLNNYSKSLH